MSTDDMLILQVESFPALYNKTDVRFKNKLAKENAWKTIGEILNTDPQICEQRWISLRAKYTNLKKKIRDLPSGSGATDFTWPYFDLMKFLDPFLATRRTISNFQKVTDVNSWDTMVQIIEEQNPDASMEEDSSTPSPLPSPTVSSTPLLSPTVFSREEPSTSKGRDDAIGPMRKKKKSSQDELLSTMTSCFSKLDNQMTTKTTEDEEFAKSLAKDMAVLTVEEKIFFKRDVYNILGEIISNRKK